MEPQALTWHEFFERHAPHYDQNPFTRNTQVEVQFLVERMGLKPSMRVLDAGCGTGRHSVELAKRGMFMVGVDLSPAMLSVAKEKGDAAGLEIEWVEANLTEWQRPGAFEAAICLCEGGFGLINQDEDGVTHDLAILRNISASLVVGAPFILTALNGYALIRRMTDEAVTQGAFDPATMVLHHLDEMDLPEGPIQLIVKERLFIPPEVIALMRFAGFEVDAVYGGTAGEWGERPLKLDEIEMMIIARKAR